MIPDELSVYLELEADAEPLHGGCISQIVKVVRDSGEPAVLKWGTLDARDMLYAEASSLRLLGTVHGVVVPEVYDCNTSESYAYVLLSYFESSAERDWEALARQLVCMHRTEAKACGFDTNNFIGSTPQENTWMDNWGEFFVHQRLLPQLTLASQDGWLTESPEALVSSCAAEVIDVLNQGDTRPVLLHGDLWSGNVHWGLRSPVLIDPACYYGSREADLAFTHLFGAFSDRFYRSYEEEYPLPRGFQDRIPILNSYHVLNHAHLFGGGYISQAQQLLRGLSRL